MAVLQKIRDKAGIFLIIFVGVALLLFIIDPTTIQSWFTRSGANTTVATIDGDDIGYMEFSGYYQNHNRFYTMLYGNNLAPNADEIMRNMAWEDVKNEHIYLPHADEVGLSCSDEELDDMLYGQNISDVIKQLLGGQTGQIDTAQVQNFFENASGDENTEYMAGYLKKNVITKRIIDKYHNMVRAGIYEPTEFAKCDYFEKNNHSDFRCLTRPYSSIADDSVIVTDDDCKAYYDGHKNRYQEKQRSRDIEYVFFDIIPSAEDSAKVLADFDELKVDFDAADGDNKAAFAARYSDIESMEGLTDMFIRADQLPSWLPADFFDMAAGSQSETILNNGSYYVVSIVEETSRPDSVRASILLLTPQGRSEEQATACDNLADSLVTVIEGGMPIAALAATYSADETSKMRGGDLGWVRDGMPIEGFSQGGVPLVELNEALFTAKKDSLFILKIGAANLIISVNQQTAPMRKIRLATLGKHVVASEATIGHYYGEASRFVVNNQNAEAFDSTVVNAKMVKRLATLSPLSRNFSGVDNAVEIVRWLYNKDTHEGSVSTVFDLQEQNKFLVAKVTKVIERGIAPFENVKDRIRPIVLKNKKAEMLIADLNNDLLANRDLAVIAQKYGALVDTITNVGFGSYSIPNLGMEPNINAVVSEIAPNVISEPIKGNNGVYLVEVVNRVAAPEKTDFTSEQASLTRNRSNQYSRLYEAVETHDKLVDMRTLDR